MGFIRLIHWNAAEAKERAARLSATGYEIIHGVPKGPDFFRELRQNPPIAVVIDLTRLPMQGRDMALAIRQHKATRHVPLIFVDGEAEKVARIRKLLPDAVYTTWSHIITSFKKAIAHPPTEPVVHDSIFAGYSGTPLAKKLGIKANSVVALIEAPPDFEKTLGDLPDGVTLRRKTSGRPDLIIWFTRSRKELERRIEKMAILVGKGALWIVWPKKASGMDTDISQPIVREAGLAAGLVDYKICAIDAIWSGLLFSQRKSVKS